jgi:MFS family permease
MGFWITTSYLLSSTITQPMFVSFSEVFGRRILLVSALFLFGLGSIICAVSPNIQALLGGRTVQGLGSGGIMALTGVLITDMVPLRERGKWIGGIFFFYLIGTSSGPPLGGAFAQNVTWRWIFWINLPLVVLTFFGVNSFLTLKPQPGRLLEKILRVDFIGASTFTLSLSLFLIPITWGGVLFAWSSPYTIVLMIVGIVGLFAFFVAEARLNIEKPFIPLQTLTNRTAVLTQITIILQSLILYGLTYTYPFYFEGAKRYSATKAGVFVLPTNLAMMPAAIAAGVYATSRGNYRWLIVTGWLLLVISTGCMTLNQADSPTYQIALLEIFSGIGFGILFPLMSLSAQASVDQKYAGMAAGLVAFNRSLGMTLGCALTGTILDNRLQDSLSHLNWWSSQYSDLNNPSLLVEFINTTDLSDSRVPQAMTALANCWKTIGAFLCAMSFVGLVLSLITREYSLDKRNQTEQKFLEKKELTS